MLGRYLFVALVHFACSAVVLKILGAILPCCLTGIYTCGANFLMYLVVARLTFKCTKKKHLNDKLQPDNRAVLITGCDSGFGHELAKHLDLEGYHVFASCLDSNGPGATNLTKYCSKRLQVFDLDVTSDDSVAKAAEFVKENLGTSELWAVVNNAGIQKGYSVELTSIADFKDVMEVNTLGPVRVTKAFLPLLRQSRGRVVNLTSFYGRSPGPYTTPYVISKHAAVAFNDCLRQELDSWGIKVISVEPELFATAITDGDRLGQNIEDTFQNLDGNVKADYGEKYLKDFKIYVEFHARLAATDLTNVILALENAVSLEYPDVIYKPSRNCFIKCVTYAYQLLPHVLQDLAVRCILYLTSFPKPKEAL